MLTPCGWVGLGGLPRKKGERIPKDPPYDFLRFTSPPYNGSLPFLPHTSDNLW